MEGLTSDPGPAAPGWGCPSYRESPEGLLPGKLLAKDSAFALEGASATKPRPVCHPYACHCPGPVLRGLHSCKMGGNHPPRMYWPRDWASEGPVSISRSKGSGPSPQLLKPRPHRLGCAWRNCVPGASVENCMPQLPRLGSDRRGRSRASSTKSAGPPTASAPNRGVFRG